MKTNWILLFVYVYIYVTTTRFLKKENIFRILEDPCEIVAHQDSFYHTIITTTLIYRIINPFISFTFLRQYIYFCLYLNSAHIELHFIHLVVLLFCSKLFLKSIKLIVLATKPSPLLLYVNPLHVCTTINLLILVFMNVNRIPGIKI